MSNRRDKYGVEGKIFVVSGPSGSGKTTLVDSLLNMPQLRNRLVRSISLTTRPRRSGEHNREDYFFINKQEFLRRRKAKKILEWTKYLGYYYATPKEFVEEQLRCGRHIVFCLDLKGALQIKKSYPKNTVTIFVIPPVLEVLQERIRKRCHKTKPEEVQRRLRLAQKEMRACHNYDYCLVNEDLKQTLKGLMEIVVKMIRGGAQTDGICTH